ncbi:hypothetical protein [Elizabethkingia miricola]|uniref:hypothetical protein n=1 Tax=Elizabethkingia miricola TaxID=172045 RepID=UPI0038927D65
MEILHIFEHIKERLLAVQYKSDCCDCFTLFFKRWSDVEYLEEFFEENKEDLQSDFWGNVYSVEDAVIETLEESSKLKKYILDVAENKAAKSLDEIFKPLSNIEPVKRQPSKVYGLGNPSWIRIYAIRLAPNIYIVTGGALKLTGKMNERDHTKEELKKLNFVRDYLKEEGIDDGTDYGYIDFI